MITCNYYKKIGCDKLSHDNKAVKAYWISNGDRGLMHVYCCNECSKIVEETESKYGMSIIKQ